MKWRAIGATIGIILVVFAFLVSPLSVELGTHRYYTTNSYFDRLIELKSQANNGSQPSPNLHFDVRLIGNNSLTIGEPLKLLFFADFTSQALSIFQSSAANFSIAYGYAYPIRGEPKNVNISLAVVNRTSAGDEVWGGSGIVEFSSPANMSGWFYMQGTEVHTDKFMVWPKIGIEGSGVVGTPDFSNSRTLLAEAYSVVLLIPAVPLLLVSLWPRQKNPYQHRPKKDGDKR